MEKFTVSTKDETFLSCTGVRNRKNPNLDKMYLESNFEKCVKNLVKMKYRLPFVF